MRTPAEKKALRWLLILIFFFFANLILVTVLVFNSLFPNRAKEGAARGTGMAPSSQTRPVADNP